MEHTHDHPHAHDHMYPHSHTCSGQNAAAGKAEETKALLTYMIHHNEHHAEDLAELMDSLPQEARKKMSIAIGSFEAANVDLRAVLDCLS